MTATPGGRSPPQRVQRCAPSQPIYVHLFVLHSVTALFRLGSDKRFFNRNHRCLDLVGVVMAIDVTDDSLVELFRY